MNHYALIRERAERGDPLCLGTHDLHRDEGRGRMWMTCTEAGVETSLGELVLDLSTSYDESEIIRGWIYYTLGRHEQQVAGRLVIELLDRAGL